MIPIFEYYFYPEFAIKNGTIKIISSTRIHFKGRKELEKD